MLWYRTAKKQGPGAPRTIYFLSPMGEEAFRAQTGRYADRKQGPSPDHADLVKRVVKALGVRRKPHPRFDVLFDEGAREWAIEVESGSNANAGLVVNLRKSLDFQPEARFVAADAATYNRILQATAREAFDIRSSLTLRLTTIGVLEASGAWDVFHFGVVSSTS